jgi:hypothetical protein
MKTYIKIVLFLLILSNVKEANAQLFSPVCFNGTTSIPIRPGDGIRRAFKDSITGLITITCDAFFCFPSFPILYQGNSDSCFRPVPLPKTLDSIDYGAICYKEYNGESFVGGGMTSDDPTIPLGSTIGLFSYSPTTATIHAITQSPNGCIVYALEIYHGDLYAAGTFDSIGGIACNNIARYDGVSWHALPYLTPVNSGWISDIKVFQDTLYICGNFDKATTPQIMGLAKLSGNQWKPVGNGYNFDNASTMYIYQNKLLVGGGFDTSALFFPPPGNGVMAWDGFGEYKGTLFGYGDLWNWNTTIDEKLKWWDGSNWIPFGYGPWPGYFEGVVEDHGGLLICGGFNSYSVPSMYEFICRYEGGVGIEETAATNSSMQVFQDIFSKELRVICKVHANQSNLFVYDLTGRLCYTKNIEKADVDERIPTTNLKSGIYVVRVSDSSVPEQYCKKIYLGRD